MPPFRNALEHIRAELDWLDIVLKRHVAQMRGAGVFDPSDPFRGLHIPAGQVNALLDEASPLAGDMDQRAAEMRSIISRRETPDLPLPQLTSIFGLESWERALLVLALAPELDTKYETLYGYAHNDVTRKLPTLDLALKLFAPDVWTALARRAAFETSTLVRERLVTIGEAQDCAFAARPIRLDERLVRFLLAQPGMDTRLAPFARRIEPRFRSLILPGAFAAVLHLLANAGRASPVVILHGAPGSGRKSAAGNICHAAQRNLLVAEAASLDGNAAVLLRREALLDNASIYLDRVTPQAQEVLPMLSIPGQPLFLGVETEWRPPMWPGAVAVACTFPDPGIAVRAAIWREALDRNGLSGAADPALLGGQFQLTPGRIHAAVRHAAALRNGHPLTGDDLHAAAKAQTRGALGRLAQKIESEVQWADIVLPPREMQQLAEIVRAIRHRERVYAAWGFERKLSLGKSLMVLFSGPSGTGKTMAAVAIARELGLDLFRVDLSAVVSKYIGETEKNLAEVFREGEESHALLFFDEADALYGKRSEIKDSKDRFANLEVAYLLQRMEAYRGIGAILATNFGKNIDDAFFRRIQYAVEFPFPDAGSRERIWRGIFPDGAPLDPTLDWGFLARQFELSGGNIRNVAVNAAFLAAEDGVIRMDHLIRATGRELQKMGRLPSKTAFRDYYDLIRD